jgi:hypothetical protein
MIIRSMVCPVVPSAWGTRLSADQVRELQHAVHAQIAGDDASWVRGHVSYVWEIRENLGLTEPAGGVRRTWDPWSPIPAKTVEITVVGIWRASTEPLTEREA